MSNLRALINRRIKNDGRAAHGTVQPPDEPLVYAPYVIRVFASVEHLTPNTLLYVVVAYWTARVVVALRQHDSEFHFSFGSLYEH